MLIIYILITIIITPHFEFNLVDFSIAGFWYKKPLSVIFVNTEKEKLNGDGKIDLVDFSIMAFNWTG